jgi:hypothetical protein
MRKVDLLFSILLVLVAPVIAAVGFAGFASGDIVARVGSMGLIVASILIFGMACMGLTRISRFLRESRKQDR